MNRMRYRKPSLKTVLGITSMKKRVKKAFGINTLLAPFRAVSNYQRRLLRRAGYYSPEMKALRAAKRGQVPGPIGPLELGTHQEHGHEQQPPGEAVLLAAALTKGEGAQHASGHETHDQQGSSLAQVMLLAAALHDEHEDHGSGGAHERKAPQKHASSARAPKRRRDQR